MEFGFVNVTTGTVEHIEATTSPKKDPTVYVKLYEASHVKVIILINTY